MEESKLTNRVSGLRRLVELHGLLLLRLSAGTIFFWFGFLKFFPGSAAENLAADTMSWLTGNIQML